MPNYDVDSIHILNGGNNWAEFLITEWWPVERIQTRLATWYLLNLLYTTSQLDWLVILDVKRIKLVFLLSIPMVI
jgi:hypothetical protein